MSEQEILESNRLIADFMQVDYSGKEQIMWRPGAYIPFTEKCLRYHSSWNWLMPVWKKITEVAPPLDEYRDYEGYEAYYAIPTFLEEVDIQKTWQYIVQFIKWYNQQNNNNE